MLAVCCWALGGCEGEASEPGAVQKQVQQKAAGPIVARVNGQPITLAEVEELAKATNLSPTEALARLEEELVLAAYAHEKGYGQDAQTARALKQARVRAMLKVAVERGTAPSDVPLTEVQQRFEDVRKRDERPEMRTITHVLFKTAEKGDEAKARAEAEALLREVSGKPDIEAQLAVLEQVPEKGKYHGLEVVRETMETFKERLEAPFADAAFALNEPGRVSRVARTSFGFHVILVRAIKPPYRLVFAEQEQAVRDQLSVEKRQAALAKLVETLQVKDAPQLDDAFVRKALADDRLLGASP